MLINCTKNYWRGDTEWKKRVPERGKKRMQESGEKEKRNNYLKGHRSREAHTHTHT